MKKLSLFLVLLVCALCAYAIPAANVTITHTQKDGTVLTLRLVGDEHMHYYQDVATGQAMRKAADGDFVVITGTELSANRESANLRRAAANTRRMARMQGPAKVGTMGTMTGQKKGIVILVNFADKSMTTGTQAKFNNMFNEQGYNQDGHIGSVADYFKAQSYDQFELSFDVVGPVTLSNNMSYYGGNNSNGNDKNPGAMIKEACNAVNSQVNFADYDWMGNGYVDQVFVIFAGYGENYSGADANTIWPHEWDLRSATGSNLTLDGKTISTYACCAELYGTRGATLNGMGTACHEFSHCLGYPDTYDIDYSGGVGMDSYDIMCGGSYNGPNGRGEVPAGFTAYERWMAGWLTPTELSSAANVTDMKDLGTKGEAYVIYNSSNKNEYFLLENRQSQDWFRYYDSNTAGHGLFITHVDFSQTVWNNNAPNDDPSHQRMAWVPADKNYGTYSSSSKSWTISSTQQKGDYFPGTSNVRSFKPTASAWNTTGGKWFTSESGSYYTNHELSEITENTTAGTISFLFDGGVIDDGNRYTITFNAGAGTCSTTSWTQTEYQQSCTLPTPTIDIDGWTFAGWASSEVSTETSIPPTFKTATYCPTQDVTLYAVYWKTTQIGGDSKFYKNATLSALTANTEYVFVAADGYALDASNLNGTASNSVAGTAVTVTDGAISTTNNNLIWTCSSVSGPSIELKNGSNYLRIRSTGLSKSTSTSNDTKWSSTNGLYYSTSSNTYNLKFNSTAKTFGSASSVDANTRVYAFVRTGQVTNVTVYNSNPQSEVTPEPEPGDGGDEGEDPGDESGEGGDEPGGDNNGGDQEDPVVPTEPGVAPLYFPHIAKLGQPFTAPAFTTDSDGAQTWTSSDTDVAEVDNEGHVTIKAVGTTIITVTQAETANYKQGTASYMIKVVE